MPNIGPGELIIILIIALVVLGPNRLPDVASSLGKSVREFRKAATDITDAAKIDTPTTTQAVAEPVAAAAPAPTPVPAAPVPAPAAPAATEPPAPNSLSGASEPNTLKADDPNVS